MSSLQRIDKQTNTNLLNLPNVSDSSDRYTNDTDTRFEAFCNCSGLFCSPLLSSVETRPLPAEARTSCPSEEKGIKKGTRDIRVPGNKVGLSGCAEEADCKRERQGTTGNRILRPAGQTNHCPSMSERIHL